MTAGLFLRGKLAVLLKHKAAATATAASAVVTTGSTGVGVCGSSSCGRRCPHVLSVQPVRSLRSRGPRGRGSPHTAQLLLDKFVKKISVEGGLTVHAPFAVKIRGSYFDEDSNVDSRRNRQAREELYLSRQFPPAVSTSVADAEQAGEEADSLSEEQDVDVTDEETLRQMEEELLRQARQDERGVGVGNSSGDEDLVLDGSGVGQVEEARLVLGGVTLPASSVHPLHLLVYGRSYHKLDSYSVVHPGSDRHCTHVHVSDAVSFGTGVGGSEEDDALFLHQHYKVGGNLHGLRACGGAALWLPHKLRAIFPDQGAEVNRDGDKMLAEVKFYIPNHLLETLEHGVRAVFLVPTFLSRVNVRTERESPIEMDGQLQNHLSYVQLMSESGDIKTRDVYASREIRLNSRSGDIMCEGVTNGHIVAETNEDGDFLARDIEGPQITVTTDSGDVNVWGDCNSDLSQFFTRVGNIHVRYMYGSCYMLIREAGTVNVNLVEGSITCVVKRGTVNATVSSITSDSNIQVSDGEITVALPPRPPFRVTISATNTNIAPRLLNSGDFYKRYEEDFAVDGDSGERETFSTGPYISAWGLNGKRNSKPPGEASADEDFVNGYDAEQSGGPRAPVLNIVANHGNVTVVINEEVNGKNSSNSSYNGSPPLR